MASKGPTVVSLRLPAVFWVGGVALVLFAGLYLLDYRAHYPSFGSGGPGGEGPGPLRQLLHYDPGTAQSALGNMAEVVVAVLGIVITVVSIVVQLAANRYTPRIADMFFRDRTNLVVLGFFVMTCIASLWVSLEVAPPFVPRLSTTATLLLCTLSLLLMIPYFAYVFDFLDPERVVARLRDQAACAALPGPWQHGGAARRQRVVLRGVEHLCDVAVNAMSNKDKLIATSAVNALRDLGVRYLRGKGGDPDWFDLGPALRENPDFVSMSPASAAELVERRTWVEWKLLRQLQAVYSEALPSVPDLCCVVAIDTRYLGEAALSAGDLEVLRLTIKFFNTYLRLTLNAGQVRTAYTVMNQYRQLAERMLTGGPGAVDMVRDVGGYLRYYAQVAHGQHLGFVTETIAYDLAALCEAAYEVRAPVNVHDDLLRALLHIDQAAETEAQEVILRGVRKAQIKLAAGYLLRGFEEGARQIFLDMKDERPERLRSIRDELLRVESKDFWEIIDRGTNFDYLDEERKKELRTFFSWFPTSL